MKPVPLLGWLVLFFALQAFPTVAHAQPVEDLRRQAWYTQAEEYFEALDPLVRPGHSITSDDEARFDEAKQRLIESMPPSDADLEALFMSAFPEDQQVGLLNVAVREAGWTSLIKCAPFLFSMQRHLQTRAMVYSCMHHVNPKTYAAVENDYLDLVSAETDKFLLPQALVQVCKIVPARNKAVRVFAGLLKTSHDDVRFHIMVVLSGRDCCDPVIKQEVISALSAEEAADALRYVREWEREDEREREEANK